MNVTGVFVRISKKNSEQLFQSTVIINTFKICVIKSNRGQGRQTRSVGFLLAGIGTEKNPVIRLAERNKQVVPSVDVAVTDYCDCEDFHFAAFTLKYTISFS